MAKNVEKRPEKLNIYDGKTLAFYNWVITDKIFVYKNNKWLIPKIKNILQKYIIHI